MSSSILGRRKKASLGESVRTSINDAAIQQKALRPIDFVAPLDLNEELLIRGLINSIDSIPLLIEAGEKNQDLNSLIWLRRECAVEISPKSPLLKSYVDVKAPEDNLDIPGDALLLGEYRKGENKIILYINNIKASDREKWAKLLIATYVHELFHEYFSLDHYVPELEEPMAELATISYLEGAAGLVQLQQENLGHYYKLTVENKGDSLFHYSFGANLYEKRSGLWTGGIRLVQLYTQKFSYIAANPELVQKYKDAVRQSDSCEATKALCEILGCNLE
ncbi:MAG: hypothetical protein IKU36_01500 [Bacteroidales bacterium]|nr:hypothetical protein [Bacteroidales bacterium]